MFYVYQLRASDESLPFYIGKTFVGSKRLIEHLSEARNGGDTMKNCKIRSVLERGAIVVEEVLERFDNEADAHRREIELITQNGRRDKRTGFLTNHTNGGEGTSGRMVSEATRVKMSTAKLGNKINVGRTRNDVVERCSKPITAFTFSGDVVGHYPSSKSAAAALDVPFACISDVLVGKVQTAKNTAGIRYQFRYGTIVDSINSPIYNRGKGKVIQLTPAGEVVAVYANAKQASEATGVNATSIRCCLTGKAKTAGKYHWQQISRTD